MKLAYCEYFLILLWFSSTVSTFNTQRTDTINEDDMLDYQILLTKNQQKRILENLERAAAKSTEKPINDTIDKRRVFFFYINNQNDTSEDMGKPSRSLDSWSIIWYIASFGGLIAFFLAISCSEWCCRHRIARNSNCTTTNRTTATTTTQTTTRNPVLDTPPPSYDQFAPPSYESINLGRNHNGEKNEYDIYIVPVHMVGSIIDQDTPPSYSNIDQNSTTR